MINKTNTILVVGSAGLIGASTCHWILSNTDHDVVGVDDLSGGSFENMPLESHRFKFYKGDAAGETLTTAFAENRPTYVCHFSCWAAEGASPFFRKHSFYTNNIVSANVVNNCINFDVKRLLFTSTMAVYGYGNNNPPFSEELIPCPIDTYGIGKYAVEMDIKVAGEQHGLDWTIIRPHNVLGKYQQYNDKFRNVLGIWMYQYLQGLPLSIFGDGEQKRSFSYIDDSIPCFYKALIQDNCSKQIINLGGIKEYTINEAAYILIEVLKEDEFPFGVPELIYVEKRHEVKYAYPTYQKSVDLLGFEHKTDLKDGLSKMWKWVKEDYKIHKRKQLTFDKFEVEKGVYPQWKTNK